MSSTDTLVAQEIIQGLDEHRLVLVEQRSRLQAMQPITPQEAWLINSAITATKVAIDHLENAITKLQQLD